MGLTADGQRRRTGLRREHGVKITGKVTAAAAAVVGTGLIVVGLRRSRVRPETADAGTAPDNAWRAVTVNKPAAKLKPDGKLPSPLAALGDRVEVRIAPAPGGKGTEIAVRARGGHDADLPPQIRLALREAKSLIETGAVLQVDPRPTGRRTATPAGKLLDAVTRRARAEGVV